MTEPRQMWEIGVEGELFHQHPEEPLCRERGCVPVLAEADKDPRPLVYCRGAYMAHPVAVVLGEPPRLCKAEWRRADDDPSTLVAECPHYRYRHGDAPKEQLHDPSA